MNHTFRNTIILALLGFGTLFALDAVRAAWSDPAGGAPTSNVALPITALSVGQTKQGGLSVGVFDAAGVAEFQQQTFFQDVLRGVKSATDSNGNITWSTAPLKIGGIDTANNTFDVAVAATGTVKTLKTFGAAELMAPKDEKQPLCADETGHIVFCPIPVPLPPSIKEISNTDGIINTSGGKIRMQGFLIGPNIVPGTTYTVMVYSHGVNVTAGTGDTPSTIAVKLIDAINNTTAAQWRDTDPASAPKDGTPGFPPRADQYSSAFYSTGGNQIGSVFSTYVDWAHQFGANVQ